MDSATTKKTSEQEKQAEIRRQIALLQAQLDTGSSSVHTPPSSPKGKMSNSHLLAPATPSPKKKKPADKAHHRQSDRRSVPRPATAASSHSRPVAGPSFPLKPSKPVPPPAPSAVIQKLAQAHKARDKAPGTDAVSRSTAFTAKAAAILARSETGGGTSNVRDNDLALIEDLTLGPSEHEPPSRVIPHDDFQNYLEGRYYISPSQLYSVIRLLPSKQGYDVPVSGDWLTIAVVAERGPMKYTQAPVGVTRDDKLLNEGEDQMDALPSLDGAAQAGPSARPPPFRKKPKEEAPKASGKKYVNLKLSDFGCRSQGGSADSGKAKIRGDAFLSLLLFESDTCDVVMKDGGKKERVYRGGSRGAFERMSKLREGAVVAFLNPKILKPFQRSSDRPHPTDNILALTPESDASIAVIGYAQDLGTCRATKRDGSRCSGWCDKRVSDVCDYHIQHAVERKRAARPEFSIGTGGMSMAAKKKAAYDPARQWGLKPEREATGATYVVQGHVISGADSRSMYVGDNVGRDAQAKAARKLSAVDSEKSLQRLLKRDREGTKILASAREFSKKQAAELKLKEGPAKKKQKRKAGKQPESDAESEDDAASDEEDPKPRGNAYSATLIKQLGFDPTAKNGQKVKDDNVQSKLDALASLHARRKIELGPRPGKRNTCVWKPKPSDVPGAPAPGSSAPATHDDLEYVDEPDSPLRIPDSDDDDDELEKDEVAAFGRPIGLSAEKFVDLDDSDEERA
ncbi:DNA replication licensing factor mcm10 [Trametes pubescens]|uniref:DNA replication licensing factor mcm10 n=1 Tax=Trametes pubescens TaxID=154538 RepID=A0A1M2V4T4_TRAPU|nr:DNA replication licensing factor mcm10 [Trametes pubescens]